MMLRDPIRHNAGMGHRRRPFSGVQRTWRSGPVSRTEIEKSTRRRLAGRLAMRRRKQAAKRDFAHDFLRKKGVRYTHPGGIEIGNVARDDREVMNQCRRGDLFVEWILGMRNT